MQLSQLLKRLSVVDGAELVNRVGATANVAKNPQTLAAFISDRYRLASIFLSLDSTALDLLRWAAVQPGHEAPWQALQAEIGDRAPIELVGRALQELRLWGRDVRIAPGGSAAPRPHPPTEDGWRPGVLPCARQPRHG